MATAIEVAQYMQEEEGAKAQTTSLRMGTIVSVVSVGRVTITLGGDDSANAVPARHLGSYGPSEGDTVLVLVQEPDLLVLGSITKGQDIEVPEGVELDPDAFTELPNGTWTLSQNFITAQHIKDQKLGDLQLQLAALRDDILAQDVIKSTHIDSGQIQTPHMAANSIHGDRISGRTIVASKIVGDSITANEINTETIAADTAFLNALEVGTAQIGDGAVTNLKVDNGAITNLKFSTASGDRLAVSKIRVEDLVVKNANIENGAITTAKIDNLQVTNAKIANLAVNNAKISDAAITTAKIGNLQVTNAKVSNLNAAKITAGSMHGNRITAGTLNADRISGGTISATISITSPNINGGTITGGTFRTTASNWIEIGGNSDSIAFSGGNVIRTAGNFGLVISGDPLLLPSGEMDIISWYVNTRIRGPSGGGSAASPIFVPSRNHPSTGMYGLASNGQLRFTHAGTLVMSMTDSEVWARRQFRCFVNSVGNQANTYMSTEGRIFRGGLSSKRFKTDIRPMTDEEADRVLKAEPVRFKSINDAVNNDHTHYGFIAEQIAEEVDPRYCEFDPILDEEGESTGDIDYSKPLSLQYAVFVVAHNSILKRHEEKIKELQDKLNRLTEADTDGTVQPNT